jgi:nicotinamidase-related amidase
MPLDPTPYIDPAHTAIVNMECQVGLLGPDAILPGLARHAQQIDLIDNLATLFESARSVGVRIYYCTDERRADGFGFARNTFVDRGMADGRDGSGGHGPVMDGISPRPEDVVFRREQGLTGFFATALDAYLRNTGVSTLVVTGLSVNIAVLGTVIEAMNRGYTVIVPSDCVVGDPPEYVESVLRYTMRNVAIVTSSAALVDHWVEVSTAAD